MRIAIGLLLLVGAALLQVTLMMRFNMLQGVADLVLITMICWMMQEGNAPSWRWGIPVGLMIGYVTALPDWVMWLGYLAAAGICQFLFFRIWQVKLLTLVSSVLLGTVAIQGITIIYLLLSTRPLDLGQSLNFILLPSMLLNLILVLPVNALISELNKLIPTAEQA